MSTISNVSLMQPVLVDYNLSQITPYVFVTAEDTARKFPMIFSNGIGCVINVAQELPQIVFPPQSGIESLKFPVLDIPTFPASQYFDIVADRIAANTAANRRTLVYCHHGRSRSITFILAYLIKHHHLPLPTAFALVKEKRQIALPNTGFWSQLRLFELRQRQQQQQQQQFQTRLNPFSMMNNTPDALTYGQEVLNKISDGFQRVLAQDMLVNAFTSATPVVYPNLNLHSSYSILRRHSATFTSPFPYRLLSAPYQRQYF